MDKPSSLQIEPPKTEYKEIGLAFIDDPEMAMRTDAEGADIDDLARSIKQVGLIEPIVVKAKGDRYEVVAGHRRRLACIKAQLELVPCHIVTATREQMEMMKIHENLYRVDINPVDEAKHYARLIKTMKLTPAQIANLTNRGTEYVRARLKILEFPAGLQDLLVSGKVTLGVATQLNRIDDPKKLGEMAAIAASQGITAGYARRWVDEELEAIRPTNPGAIVLDNMPNIGPIEEQRSKCFYCMDDVSLINAYTVYVHNHCIEARNKAAQEESPEPPAPAAEPTIAAA